MRSKLTIIILAVFSALFANAQAQQDFRMKAQGEHYTGEIFMKPAGVHSDKTMTVEMELAAGAHNDWHIHPDAVQTLFVLEGIALYQEDGKPVQMLRQGELVSTPANVKHWNGAPSDHDCKIVTVSEISGKAHVEWLGKVDDAAIIPALKIVDDMLIRISEIEVHPEYLEEYLAAAKTVGAESVAKEPGVICIYPMIQQRDSCQIRILEIYASQEAYQSHIKTEHFQTYKQGTLHMVKSLDLVDMKPMNAEGMWEIFRKME